MSPRTGLDLQSIVEKAAKLADSNGIETVTLANVAASLNVKSPSLYNHVKGLSILKIELAKYGYLKLNEKLVQATIGHSKDEAVYQLGNSYVKFVSTHPGLYDAMIRTSQSSDNQLGYIQSKSFQIVLQVMNAYKLGEEETIHAVRGLRSLLHGFASLERNGEFGLPLKLENSLEFALKLFIEGIKVQDKESK